MGVSGRIVRDAHRIAQEAHRQMEDIVTVISGKGFSGGGYGVDRHFYVRSEERAPGKMAKDIYLITLTGSRQIVNGSETKNIKYMCPDDEGVPWGALSLQDWFRGLSWVLRREFPPPFEMCELRRLRLQSMIT